MDNDYENKIICGDNLKECQSLPNELIDLVVTSPPYGEIRNYDQQEIKTGWDFEGLAKQFLRILKPGGMVCWNCNDETKNGSESGTSFRQALYFMNIGFLLHDTMIYKKPGFSFPENVRYHQLFEYVFILSKGKPKTFNPIMDKENVTVGDKYGGDYKRNEKGQSVCRKGSMERKQKIKKFGMRGNVWEYTSGLNQSTKDAIAFNHPAIMPEGLARDLILSFSNEGDLVLDPFSGSGTTAKMAKHNGRKYLGIEINEKYVEISKKRLAQKVLF